MQRSTLKKYLTAKRLELYEKVDELKTQMLSSSFTERDTINLEVSMAQLDIIKDIYEICENRKRF